jgi:hypothetical protein
MHLSALAHALHDIRHGLVPAIGHLTHQFENGPVRALLLGVLQQILLAGRKIDPLQVRSPSGDE